MNLTQPFVLEHQRTEFQFVVQRTLESLLGSKEIKLINPKGNEPWIFTGRTDAKSEAPILWPPDEKSQLIGKDSDAGKNQGQEENGATEDEMVGRHHWLNGHEFRQTLEMVKDREAWFAGVHGVAKSWTWLSDWTTKTASQDKWGETEWPSRTGLQRERAIWRGERPNIVGNSQGREWEWRRIIIDGGVGIQRI